MLQDFESFAQLSSPLPSYILAFSIVIEKSDEILITDPLMWLYFPFWKILESVLDPKVINCFWDLIVAFYNLLLFYTKKNMFFSFAC